MVILMETAQRLDQKKVYWEPDGTAPVGIAAEEAGGGFRRLIVNLVIDAGHIQHVRLLFMMTRERANAMRREELIFIEHDGKNARELFAVSDGKQAPPLVAGGLHAGHVFGEVFAIFNEPFQ